MKRKEYINKINGHILGQNKQEAIDIAGSEDLISMVEIELGDENRDIYFQNYLNYKWENGKLIRFNSSENLKLKERYLARIRTKRSRVLRLYDIYETKILRGKEEESQEVEDWYQWILDFPETYDNNIPYQEQVRYAPEVLRKYK